MADPDAAPPAEPAPPPAAAPRRREVALVAALALLLFLPTLGSTTLWDPWETHYSEVGRRMLEDGDLIVPKWQHEIFRSKPVLTFWMMAASLRAVGAAEGGGYSGEFVSSHRAEWGLRLPFMLFGVAGIAFLWWMIARFGSRRAAWLAAAVVATSPFYFLIARQAITDMPSCGMLVMSMALLAYRLLDGDRPLRRWRGLTANHAFLAAFALVTLAQLVYYHGRVDGTVTFFQRYTIAQQSAILPFYVLVAAALLWCHLTARTTGQVAMYWFYLIAGLAVLAKGPIAPAISALAVLGYLAVTGEWRKLLKLELAPGILIFLSVAVPWHVAMFLRDGMPWYKEYVGTHLLGRAFVGVYGDRGSFLYFFGQLGVGMWPWVALVPAALVHLAFQPDAGPAARDRRLALFLGIWGVVGYFFFSMVPTKFHHYVLPAVPALGAVVALWLDDALAGRARGLGATLAVALGLLAVTSIDLVTAQHKLAHLFIFRYDRPWPYGPPWFVDYRWHLLAAAVAFGAVLLLVAWTRVRRVAVYGLVALSLAFAVFTMQVIMRAAAPHWGQRALDEKYYRHRRIFGVDYRFTNLADVRGAFAAGRDVVVRTLVPETLHPGDPMIVTWEVNGEKGDATGQVARLGRDRFWITFSPEERAKLDRLLERAASSPDRPGGRYVSINADRLIAWQLNWRGENLYTGGEIHDPQFEDSRTVFMDLDNVKFLAYLKAPARSGKGRKFWLITEKGRVDSLKGVLPTQRAKDTLRIEDNSCNKFGLVSFTLD